MLFLKFLAALQIIHAYFLANYLLERNAVKTTKILGSEINITAITDPYYWFALNV